MEWDIQEQGEELPPIDYRGYLKTEEWKMKSSEAKQRASFTCELCGCHEDELKDAKLEVHHVSYVRLGYEKPEDLVVLCSDCHRKIHEDKVTFEEAREIYKNVELWPEKRCGESGSLPF